MSTLKYAVACRLPTPTSPTRRSIQNTSDALHNLGFDAKFDLELECTADAILSSEVTLEKRLRDALQFAEQRRGLVSLPCARLRFSKLLREDAELPPSEDSLQVIAEKVASAGAKQGLTLRDVQVGVTEEALECCVDIRGGPLLFAVRDVLALATRDKGGGLDRGDHSGIHRAFFEAGGPENITLKVVPEWPLDRLNTQLQLIRPEYALAEQSLERLQGIVSDSQKAFDAVWLEVDDTQHDDVQAVVARPDMACFSGQLLPAVEGRLQGLREEHLAHGARDLHDLMADAAQAHLQLKELLAPRTAWATTSFDDPYEVPLEDERRDWVGGSGSLAPGGIHHDPGTKSWRSVLDEAKGLQRPEHTEPPVQYVLDASSVAITFEKVKDLPVALERVLAYLDVVWVHNGIANPTTLGYRSMSIGVRQMVESRAHISTLELHIKAMSDATEGVAGSHHELVRALLAEVGVRPRELDKVRSKALELLVCTQFVASRSSERVLLDVVAFVGKVYPPAAEVEKLLAERLVHEVAEQALASGVPEESVREAVRAALSADPSA
mmetsp:Transcript_79447/g.221087  ORF Transcript_79447/g.221087 Transcript_79447/m.221087 type:complete len:553 (+) Transcript_79447:152-1810(+)